jgi:hypothetical protein
MADSNLLTVPPPLTEDEPYWPIANEYVALPTVRPNGWIDSVNVLSMEARGLLEFASDPLILPSLSVDGQSPTRPVARSTPACSASGMIARPELEMCHGVIERKLIFAPPGQRGFVVLLEATNGASEPHEVTFGLLLRLDKFNRAIFSRREMDGQRHLDWDRWTRSLVVEMTSPVGSAALAVAITELLGDQGFDVDAGRAGWSQVIRLSPGETQSFAFYFGVAQERDGARTTTMDLRRQGWQRLLADSEEWVETHRPAGLPHDALGELAARNLLFNQCFATGRTIDTDELVLVTSRSPLYYVSAAFWARDALLWSFPGLTLTDVSLAREALITAFARHFNGRNAGVHAHYINGVVLYPGFELDQLAAFVIALERYTTATNDWGILHELDVARGLDAFPARLAARQHSSIDLYSTFLLSTDDPTPAPYVTYDNVLVWRALTFLAQLKARQAQAGASAKLARLAAHLHEAIWKQCVVDGSTGKQFAGAVDLQGRSVLLDEPPGSLALLPHYGFCSADETAFLNTLQWIDSPDNPHLGPAGRFQTASCSHAPYSWTLSLANMLLSGRGDRAAEILRSAPLDGGLACETFDVETGLPKTGRHFATCAGFLGYALYTGLKAEC